MPHDTHDSVNLTSLTWRDLGFARKDYLKKLYVSLPKNDFMIGLQLCFVLCCKHYCNVDICIFMLKELLIFLANGSKLDK